MITTQRLTISLPQYLYQQLTTLVGSGRISGFIAKLLEKEMLSQIQRQDPVDTFLRLRRLLPKKTQAEIKKAIEQGRT